MMEKLTRGKAERQKVSVHIMMNPEVVANIKEMADYAAEVGIIPSDSRGNMTNFIGWCIDMGREALRQYCLKRRGFI